MPYRLPRGSAIAAVAVLALSSAAVADTLPTPPLADGPASRAVPVRKAACGQRRSPVASADQVYGGADPLPIVKPAGYESAPMPNDEIAPTPRNPPAVNTEPKLFTVKTQYKGDGFPYGATVQGLDDKHEVRIPGVNVTVPLAQ